MDVDNEDTPRRDDQTDDTEMEEGDAEHSRTSKKTVKTRKNKNPRKSELDMAALNNEQEALAALESNQLLHLRLRKRYYAEGLNFIRQVEEGMKTVQRLLASTNKLEVLEAIEFFRVTYEYQFDGAEVRVFAANNIFFCLYANFLLRPVRLVSRKCCT